MINKIRIFIIEDELIHAEALKLTLNECNFELAGECNNADESYDLIKKSKPDLILADISLPGIMNGMSLSKKIHEELGIPHIFVTSYSQDDIIDEAIKTHPSGYLRKPVDAVNLKVAVKIALQYHNNVFNENPDITKKSVFTKVGNKLIRIDLDKILIVKADGENFISLVTEKKEIPCRATLKDFCGKLPSNFMQVHRSFYININYLDAFNELDQSAVLGKHQVPVGRSYKKSLIDSLFRI